MEQAELAWPFFLLATEATSGFGGPRLYVNVVFELDIRSLSNSES